MRNRWANSARKSLPAWAKAFDVAIIPYRLTRQVVHSAPLKLREYLASGKPIVAVSTPEIDCFADCVRIARTPDDFLREIEEALAHDSPADRARRIEATRGMTWEDRMREVTIVVEEALQRNASRGR